MGKVVYRIDRLNKKQLKASSLNLVCLCATNRFDVYVSESGEDAGMFAQSEVFEASYPMFHEPLGFLKKSFRQNPLLFDQFSRITVALADVPFHILKSSSTDTLQNEARERCNPGAGDALLINSIAGTDTHVAFAVPKNFLEELELYFHSPTVVHSIYASMRFALTLASANTIFVQIGEYNTTIVVKQNGVLEFANQYRLHGHQDATYYLAAIAEVAELQLDSYDFYITGAGFDQRTEEEFVDCFGDIHRIEFEDVASRPYRELKIIDECVS